MQGPKKEKIKELDQEKVKTISLGSIISKRRLNTRAVTLVYQIRSLLLQRNLRENLLLLGTKMRTNRTKDDTKAKSRSRMLLELTVIVNGDKDNQSEDKDQWKQHSQHLNPFTELDIAVAHELEKYVKIWLKMMVIVLARMNSIMTGMARVPPLEIVLPEVT